MNCRVRVLCPVIVLFAVACGGDVASGRGKTVVVTTAGEPETLLPPVATSTAAKAVFDVVFDHLADVGPELNTVGDVGFEPRLAERWEWSADSLRLTLHLNSRARWHDGQPVRALDVRFAFELYRDSLTASPDGPDLRAAIDSISVGDSLTATVWYRQRSPDQFYKLVSALVPLPEHLLRAIPHDSLRASAFARAPVGSGPFRFVSWEKTVRLEIAAVDNFYRGRAGVDRVIWSISADMPSAIRKLMAGEADFLEALTPDAVAEAAKQPQVKAVPYGSFDYGFLRFNLRDGASARPHPVFGDRATRRALSMALDRALMVRNLFDTLGRVGLGPFVRVQWSADTTLAAIAFDRAAAAHMLDSLGWRSGPDSVRVRAGRPLAFSLLVPSSSRTRGRLAVLIQEQLRQVGAKVNIESLDFSAFMARAAKSDFDAMMDAVHANVSPGGARQTWGTAGIHAGRGPNFGAYTSRAFDTQVDSALAARDVATARAHFRTAYQVVIDDAPAVWLFEPVAVAGVSARIQTGPIRADGWWMGLARWTVGRAR